VPLILADRIGWHASYAMMAALMAVGMGAVLMAPREAAHTVRAIPSEGAHAAPLLEALEWLARLLILALGALLLGSGLGANATVLSQLIAGIGLPGAAAALKAAWNTGPDSVWLQLAGVLAGFGVIVLAAWPIPGMKTRPGLYLSHALGDPLADFFGRFGKAAGLILALICLYRLSDFVLNIMTPFYLDLGFSKTQIAEARKVFGVVMSMIGVFAGGFSVARLGVMRSMVIGAFALPIANTIYGWLATQGPDFNALLTAIGIDNVVSGYAGTCLIAYMSSLTSAGFTATQYALFSSLYSLPGKLIASQSGRIVEGVAKGSDQGGPWRLLQGLFSHMRPDAFANAMTKSHVSPAALGAGYVAFFIYSGLVGVASMVLAVLVYRAQAASIRARAS
jgi:PAT family beta-lactamase induction signal transducer AmpG